MSKFYYCTKCGKPIDVYSHQIPDNISCICCCQKHKKLLIPEEYIKYIANVVPVFNYEYSEEFVNKILKNEPNFEEALSWFKRKDELEQKFANDWQTIKATQQKKSNVPKCPTCQSTNIRKIGSVERGASIFMLGIFSKKINKTFKCNNCGYTW